MDNTASDPSPLSREELRDIIDLALWAGQLLLQHGAETSWVEKTVHYIGTGLGCNDLDVLVSPNAIMATTISGEEFRTKIRRVTHIGVNMDILAAVNTLRHRVEDESLDRQRVRAELERIDQMPPNYNRWLVAGMVGLACAAFARLSGGDAGAFAVTFVASALAMVVRQELTNRHFNGFVVTVVTAFAAGILASSVVWLQISAVPEASLSSAVLLLVPGVPLVNAAEDLIKGHMVTGIVRGVSGVLISLGIALGLLLALRLTGSVLL